MTSLPLLNNSASRSANVDSNVRANFALGPEPAVVDALIGFAKGILEATTARVSLLTSRESPCHHASNSVNRCQRDGVAAGPPVGMNPARLCLRRRADVEPDVYPAPMAGALMPS